MEVSLVKDEKGGTCACGNPLEGNERTCKACKAAKDKEAEKAMKSLARNIPSSTLETAKAKPKSEFFIKPR